MATHLVQYLHFRIVKIIDMWMMVRMMTQEHDGENEPVVGCLYDKMLIFQSFYHR